MGLATTERIAKVKKRPPATGKRGEPGRFVTLKTGRVIFIPEGQRTKWADVRDEVLSAQRRKPLSELVKMMPKSTIPAGTGIEGAKINDYGEDGKALWKVNTYGSAESELMAYEFSESIGWGIVPETIMPEGTKDVSVQRWVEGETLSASEGAWGVSKNSRVVTMDTLLDNLDRHAGNILVDKDGKQWAIDNNQAFGAYAIWETPAGITRRVLGHGYNYESVKRGTRVTRDYAGLIDAAKDVARWFKTPAYREYVAKLKETHGEAVARQFGLNVADLADWSRKARVVE